MRYIGNKDKVTGDIINMMKEHELLNHRMTFFDAFCGTGVVSESIKHVHDIVINDSLSCCSTYSYGRLVGGKCKFRELGVDPFQYLNATSCKKTGFIYKTYSPFGGRMYFTETNAKRIDYFRFQIEEWHKTKKIIYDEYQYLIACLIEAVSAVSNTAGVYGAFLKKWDKRALKDIIIKPLLSQSIHSNSIIKYNEKIEDIIGQIKCDILYLDPPYTQNQYGTQYHLLETLVLGDEPSVSTVTGSRPTGPMRSQWSKDIFSHILFEKILAETNAKHILISYNNDGFMSKEYITSTMKIHGIEETFDFKEISYSNYTNHKSKSKDNHYEYLFYIQKKYNDRVVLQSPLNYIGSKAKMVNIIKSHLPQGDIHTFIDLFGGGFNVGINIDANNIIYNDLVTPVSDLIKMFYEYDAYALIKKIRNIINRYGLSIGASKSYLKLRSLYNKKHFQGLEECCVLYALIMYGFQQQIRFNSKGEFNNPPGTRFFNDNLLAKFISFSRVIHSKKLTILNLNFQNARKLINKDVIIYLDPPYLHTTGSYNDGKRGYLGWNKRLEDALCEYIDFANMQGAKFLFSYMICNEHITNHSIVDWANSNNYMIIPVKETQGRYNNRSEVIITNFHNNESNNIIPN